MDECGECSLYGDLCDGTPRLEKNTKGAENENSIDK
jgi:hypothetical protein